MRGRRAKKSGALTTIIVILIFVVGLSLLLYPTVSEYWNSRHQSQAIADYAEQVNQAGREANLQEWQAAEAYNQDLLERSNPYQLDEGTTARYERLLDTTGRGIMGYLEIPTIDCTLSIYHGTDEAVLQVAIGHIEWTSLPVGGESTHSVISGHRGLPSAELLTNIDHLELGDVFYIHVLGETLEYRVDNIAVVEPDDLSLLGIEEGEDYVTLLTCTPYGINSHRLLVRGTRVEYEGEVREDLGLTNEVREIDMMYLVPAILLVLIVVVFVWLLIDSRRRKKKKGGKRLIENMEQDFE